MGKSFRFRFKLWLWPLLLCVGAAFGVYQERTDYLPVPEQTHPLDNLLPQKGIGSSGGYLKINSEFLKRQHNVNFDKRSVEIVSYLKVGEAGTESSKKDSITLSQAYYQELNSYSMDMNDLALRRLWLNQFVGKEDAGQATTGGLFDLTLPVTVPDWMRRIGVEAPRLRINGSYKLVVEGKSITGNGSPINSGWFPSLHMDQQPAISVKGSIGRLINVEINSEEGFGTNLKDQLKISYKGEGAELEDEIIQEIEAGNTSLTLTGTSLTGYTETHKGIFGLKMRMRFGGLEVTTIASQEGGSQERQTLGTGTEARTFTIEDKAIDLHKHFFLKLSDRKDYADQIEGVGTPKYISAGQGRREVEVFQLLTSNEDVKDSHDSATAYLYDSSGNQTGITEYGRWKSLKVNDEFVYDEALRMLSIFQGQRSTSYAVRWTNDFLMAAGKGRDKKSLILIHSRNGAGDANLEKLLWMNVYNIGKVAKQDRDNFQLEVRDNDSRESNPGDTINFTRTLGLQKVESNKLDFENEQVFNFDQGLLILPCKSKVAKDGDLGNCFTPMRRVNKDTKIYTESIDDISNLNSTHKFLITGKQRKSSFDVRENSQSVNGSQCLDITPGTEKLTINGSTVLTKDADYEVLYETGQITLISPRAKDPNAKIDISYECTPPFQIQDKVLLGTRFEYKLDNISEESILGATVLYKSQNTTSTQPELGREPFNQLLWGFNARLSGSPAWMTKLVNKIPFIATEAKSKANFEFEIAQSRYNPNTKGTAFLDNFESSQNSSGSMPLNYYTWFQSSPPGNTSEDALIFDDSLDYRHRGRFIWHSNLKEQYSRIYGSTGNTLTNSREQTLLKLSLLANDNLQGHSWGGVMRGFSPSSYNQSRKRSLEVVVNGREGNLYVDMGQISEDLSINGEAPNGHMDSELKPGEIKNTRDAGLDNVTDAEGEVAKNWQCLPNCFYSLKDNSNTGGDAAQDNFDANKVVTGESDPATAEMDGTEGNNKAADGASYDTEDLDRSGNLDSRNRYMRYAMPLDSACSAKFYCEQLQNGWRKYLIPLYGGGKKIDPTNIESEETVLKNVKIMRLWMGKLPKRVAKAELLLARINIVGNAWEEGRRNTSYEINADRFTNGDLPDSAALYVPTATPDSNALKVEVINKQEDRNYIPSPNTIIEKDTRSNEPIAEKALVLKYENLHEGEVVHATRLLGNDPKDLTLYSRIRMEIHPNLVTAASGQGKVTFGLRLGKDLGNRESKDYYEIRLPMDGVAAPGSDEKVWLKNSFNVSLDQLTNLKNEAAYRAYTGREVSHHAYHEGRGDTSITLSVVGNPTLSRIDWMRLVVYVDSGVSKQSGEIWVDDLRLEGVDKSIGSSMRTSLQLDFADFINLSGNLVYRNGGFTTMSETKATPANSASKVDYNGTASLYANKFFPDVWGLNIPLSIQYSGSINRPFTKPTSDLNLHGTDLQDFVNDLWHDNLRTRNTLADSLADIENQRSRYYQTTQFDKRFTTSYKKDHRSGNFWIQSFLERPDLSYTYSTSDHDEFYKRSNTIIYNTKMLYNLSPFSNPSYKPLAFGEKQKYFPAALANLEITPLPEKLNLTLADLSYARTDNLNKPIQELDRPVLTRNFDVELSHGVDMEWRLINVFNFGYRLSVNRNFDPQHQSFADGIFETDRSVLENKQLAKDLVFKWDDGEVKPGHDGNDYFIVANEFNRNQSYHMDYTNNSFAWLTHGINFSSGYKHTRVNDVLGPDGKTVTRNEHFEASSDHDIKLSSSLSLPTLFSSLSSGMQKWKSLATAFDNSKKGLDYLHFRNIDASYSVSHKYNNEEFTYAFLNANPSRSNYDFYAYSLGWLYDFENLGTIFKGEPRPTNFDYLMKPNDSIYASQFNHVVNRTIDINSGFTFPGIDLSLTGSVKYSKGYTLHRGLSPSDTSIVFPDISSTGTLGDFSNKIPLLHKHFRTMTASTTYNYRDERSNIDQFSNNQEVHKISHKFNPLLRLAATTNGDIRLENSFNFGFDRSNLFNKIRPSVIDSVTKKITPATAPFLWYNGYANLPVYVRSDTLVTIDYLYTFGDDFSVSYDVETQKGIQFWRYYVKLQNNLRLKTTVGASYALEKRDEPDKLPHRDKDMFNCSVKPEATYSFTNNVDALFYLLYRYEKLFHTATKESTHQVEIHGEFTMRF